MTEAKDPVYGILWSDSMEEVDRELARLAMLCQVRILDPQVVARVLKNDFTDIRISTGRHFLVEATRR